MATNFAFSASEICAMIVSCHQNGVASLKIGDLSVEFFQLPRLRGNVAAGFDNQARGGETPAGAAMDLSEPATLILTDEDKAVMEEAQLAQLLAEDPMAYEQQMIDATLNAVAYSTDE